MALCMRHLFAEDEPKTRFSVQVGKCIKCNVRHSKPRMPTSENMSVYDHVTSHP